MWRSIGKGVLYKTIDVKVEAQKWTLEKETWLDDLDELDE